MTLEIELGCLRTTATLLGDKPFICTLYSSVSDVTIPQSQLLVVVRVFLDLHQHKILISKLSVFNLSKRSLSWFESYLRSREKCFVINNIKNQQKSSKEPSGSHPLQSVC